MDANKNCLAGMTQLEIMSLQYDVSIMLLFLAVESCMTEPTAVIDQIAVDVVLSVYVSIIASNFGKLTHPVQRVRIVEYAL